MEELPLGIGPQDGFKLRGGADEGEERFTAPWLPIGGAGALLAMSRTKGPDGYADILFCLSS